MSISIGANLPAVGKITDIASPSGRQTDQACAAQDAATETISQGRAPERGALERFARSAKPARAVRRLVASIMARPARLREKTFYSRTIRDRQERP